MYRNKLLAKLHILLKETGAEAHKKDIYAGYGVDSAKEMSDDQIVDLIGRLDASTQNHSTMERSHPVQQRHEAANGQIRALRSDVLFVLTANPDAQSPRRRGLGIPNDWQILNPFIHRHAGKLLYEMTDSELRSFKTKLCAMRQTGWRYKGGDIKRDDPDRHSVPPVSVWVGIPAEGTDPVN